MLITALWRKQPGKYFCISTKSPTKEWRDNFFSRSQFGDVQAFIDRNRSNDIYFCPHGFTDKRRKEQYAVMPKLLWADLDEADPETIKIKPSIAIESSPGRFVGLWVLDEPLDDKNTNKRLTYMIGADKGGWDLTQVLRVPRTLNYKYKSTPKVRVLWDDGPEYELDTIKRKLPKTEGRADDSEARELLNRHKRKLAYWARREILDGQPAPGKRSEMMWKLANHLSEVGLSKEDSFTLLSASPWNKFAGRDDQLHRELDKVLERQGHKPRFHKDKEEEPSDYKFLSIPMSEVEEENIDWIWYPYLARGELSILEGDPGLGKSYMAQMVAAAIADGRRLPSVKRLPVVQGKIAYFDLENSAATVTKKRLTLNICTNMSNYYQEEEPFSIDNEEKFEAVLEAIERMKPTLVVFDTINSYIGSADIHKSSEAQQAFAPFRRLATRFNCAVLVLRHLTKGTKERALYRGQGSISFAGLARVVMTVGQMPDDPETRVMAVTKINVTQAPKALTFNINALPDTLKEQDRSKFIWGEFVDLTSDDIISAPLKKEKKEDARDFLTEILADGAVEVGKIQRMAESRAVSWRTVQRSADEMGVTRKTKGFGSDKKTVWRLPHAE